MPTPTLDLINGGQLSARPCALRLCIKATSDSRDRLSGGGSGAFPEAGQPTTSRSTCHRTVTLLWSHESATHSQFAAHHSLTQHWNKQHRTRLGWQDTPHGWPLPLQSALELLQTLTQSGGTQCKRARAEPLTVPDVVLVMQPLYGIVQEETDWYM